jgi:hypothetical protein
MSFRGKSSTHFVPWSWSEPRVHTRIEEAGTTEDSRFMPIEEAYRGGLSRRRSWWMLCAR